MTFYLFMAVACFAAYFAMFFLHHFTYRAIVRTSNQSLRQSFEDYNQYWGGGHPIMFIILGGACLVIFIVDYFNLYWLFSGLLAFFTV